MKTLIVSLLMAFGLSIAAPVDVQACGDHKSAKKSDKSKVEQASYDTEKETEVKQEVKKSESKKSDKIKARKKSEAKSSSTADVDDE